MKADFQIGSVVEARGLIFEIVWSDEDVLKIRLQARSQNFSGCTSFYADLDEPAKLAECLDSFPRNLADVRRHKLGEDAPGMLRAGALLQFQCVGGSGQVFVAVEIWTQTDSGEREAASLSFRTLPAMIDNFVSDLRGLKNLSGVQVRLGEAI